MSGPTADEIEELAGAYAEQVEHMLRATRGMPAVVWATTGAILMARAAYHDTHVCGDADCETHKSADPAAYRAVAHKLLGTWLDKIELLMMDVEGSC